MRSTRNPGATRRLSPLAIALLVAALLLGSTGGAVAGAMITGKQIKNGTVTSADIKNNSLQGKDVKDGTLTGADIADEAMTYGAADDTLPNGFTSNIFTTLVQRALTTRAGYLTIVASLSAQDAGGGDGKLVYRLKVDGKLLEPLRFLDYGNASDFETGALTHVIQVGAGAHVVELVAAEYGGAQGSNLWDAELSIIHTAGGASSGVVYVP